MASSMVWLLLPSLFLLVHAATSLPTNYTTISRDVVVIGGGSSGTYAAVNLLARGRSVAVLEQQGRLGGHVETYHDPATDAPFNLGVILYYNNTINNAYFSLLGVPTSSAVMTAGGNAYLDFATGKPVPGFDPETQADAFLPALLAFNSYLYDLYAQNTGNLWQLPTYHAIHAFDPKLIQFFLQGFINAASGDNQDIYTAAAAYLGSENVFLNSTILDVDRSGSCFGAEAVAAVCVLSTAPASPGTGNTTTLTKARKLLVAIPPSLPSLASAQLDLDAHERALFAAFHGFTYGVTVFSAPGLNSSEMYYNVGTKTPDHLLAKAPTI
ncbi:hypothetical protein B0H11DRAFT_2303383 [Mycena galericulata]|nr:hypothetical protein B0H11DRAFT_2303383 [Mycena galericulata]